MRQLMQEQLPADTCELLNRVAELAGDLGVSVYVVGGFVRDLLLKIENLDIDLVVEGDGLAFARRLAEELNAEVTPHSKFGTSVLHLADGSHLDVATARREVYEEPAALPIVQPGAIHEDMGRRDFTINSLAIKLEPDGARSLLDLNKGNADLDKKRIRVLHAASFIDDPTRIFRAVRFEQRLRFRLSAETETWLIEGVPGIKKLSGYRLFNELAAIFKEKNIRPCILRMQELGVLKGIDSRFHLDEQSQKSLERLSCELSQPDNLFSIGEVDLVSVWTLALLWSVDQGLFVPLLQRFGLEGKAGDKFIEDRNQCLSVLKQFAKAGPLSALEVYEIFSKGSIESAYWLLAVSDNEEIKLAIGRYFSYLKETGELSLTGDDLIRMGLKPGPLFQEVFCALRSERLEGRIHSREEEENLVRKRFLDAG